MRPARAPEPPPEVAELVGCIGVENTMRLLALRGGTRLHVPKTENVRTSFLTAHLDEVSLMRLAGSFGGTLMRLPLCREWRARVLMAEGGRSHPEIALMVGATESFVQRLASSDWTPMARSHKGMRQVQPDIGTKQLNFELI
jgi:hypothetical protein